MEPGKKTSMTGSDKPVMEVDAPIFADAKINFKLSG